MIKLVYCIRRRADVPVEEFYRYWRNAHAPKVTEAREALRMRRYVQSHTGLPEMNEALRTSRGDMPEGYDGITEVWWDSAEDLQAAMATSEGQQAMQMLIEDEARFIDHARSRVFMTSEHTIFE